MNYYEARKRESDDRWDWTGMNDGKVRTMPPCTDHTDGHATSEEADRHFYDYEAENLREFSIVAARHPCQVPDCPHWTDSGLSGRYIGTHTLLCEDHDSRDGWKAANPFEPGIRVMASW